jgi:5-oxoprolinase (ATP-hydrolysing) subunit A
MTSICLNCDMGEGLDNDAALMPFISLANIACGYHAGDAATMEATVRLALQEGVAIGAHPAYPDRIHFGRKAMSLSVTETFTLITTQVALLAAICAQHQTRLHHVKPHGALYNTAAADKPIAAAIADAIIATDPTLILLGPPQSALAIAAQEKGLSFWAEAFADRSYQPDGQLTPRSHPGAVLTETAPVIAQTLDIALHHRVKATDGRFIPLQAQTLCIHGDGVTALPLAIAIHDTLTSKGLNLKKYGHA